MEYQKITNLLGNIPDKVPRFITKKWVEVHDQSGETYNTNKQIRFKTLMLRSDLCDYSDTYIVVKGKITVTNPDNDAYDKKLAFTDNAPCLSCISKINNTFINNAEDFDIVMPMYNLLEYSKNYGKTTGSLWNYYRDELNSGAEGNINFSVGDDNKLLKQLKTGFKRTITWNKYRSDMSNQTKNNNLNYLIDPTFTNVSRLVVLTFENEDVPKLYTKS